MKVSEAILVGAPWFDEDQHQPIFSFEDMVYAFNWARTELCFSSTDDYYEKIVSEEDAILQSSDGGKYTRKNFKEIVSASLDCVRDKTYVTSFLIKNIIESL